MPKTSLCKLEKDKRLENLRAIITCEMERKQINNETLAKRIGVSQKTMNTRRSHPETFRLEELLKVLDILKPDYPNFPDEILRKQMKK